jgi:hypothetical protein
MSPIADATIKVVLGRVLVSGVIGIGLNENSILGLVLDVTSVGAEPYTLSATSISCWLELSPELPGETLSLTPAGGGEGESPGELRVASIVIPPGQTRTYWVQFRGYRYPGSDVPRRIVIALPDARGRRLELVIADPARANLRWEVEPLPLGGGLGFQQTVLSGSALDATAMAVQFDDFGRAGPILWDAGVTLRLLVERAGQLTSETSGFTGIGWHAHVAVPLVGWGPWQSPRLLGPNVGGEAQWLSGIRHAGENEDSKGVLAAEGGLEMDFGAQLPVASPFPITLSRPPLPRWTARVGYTHWWFRGGNSGGATLGLRLGF